MEHYLSKMHVLLFLLCISFIECNFESLHETQSNVKIDEEELKNGVLLWSCPFKDSVKTLNETKNWYKFLNSLYCKFSEYKIQAAKRNYTNKIAEFCKQNCEINNLMLEIQRTEIDENSFEKFLNKTAKCNITKYDIIKDIRVTEKHIEELNNVLNLTIRDTLHVKCEGANVYIKGNYITTGDIIDILFFKRRIKDTKCEKLLSNDKTMYVNIFALNTFFTDISINASVINLSKIVLMSVIAPKWESIGKNKIDLNGKDVESPTVGNGMDGKPGKPGNPGRSFFGIGIEFVNGINLEISVSGGDGSHGQEGKKGENGRDGTTPATPPTNRNFACGSSYCTGNKKINDFNCRKLECEYTNSCGYRECHYMKWCKYEIFGTPGTKGQNGGKGGKGGRGGQPGNIELIEVKFPSQISLLRRNGQDGADGKGGAGGIGGRNGNDITVECRLVCSWWESNCWTLIRTEKKGNAKSGQNGANGGNTNGMENPKLAVAINNLDKAKIINKYKSYLRENLHGSFTKAFHYNFLKHLDTNINIKKVYDTLGFIDEVVQLEEQFQKLNKYINTIPFYESLLNRISEYAYSPKEIGDPGQYKKVLCYLYTATLGRMHNIHDNKESNLIIDIYAYLSSVRNDIEKLKDLKNSKYKERIISKYKDEYKNKIDIKIKEAQELILKEIIPEVDNVGHEIDRQLETLVNEVIYLQKETSEERKDLIAKRNKLKNILQLQGLFSVFKIIGAVVTFLGPIGRVAGSVIETGSTIAESFITDNAGTQTRKFELPQSVSELKSIENQIKNIFTQRVAGLNNSLESISLQIIKHPDILSNMLFKILNIKNKLDKLDKKKLNFQEIEVLESELAVILQKEEDRLNHQNKKQLRILKNLKRFAKISTFLSDFYGKYKYNEEKLDAISSALDENDNKMQKLKEYEQQIYNSIMPMLQNIQNDLQDIISKLGTKSKVALDVTKWQVQSTLRDMILIMHQLTRGFEVGDNLARCLGKFKETMDTLINVHCYIKDYQKDQSLANYIAEISSITVSDIVIGHDAVLQEVLRHAVRNLEITVRSNIVLQRYKIALNAFKQFVFPFAHNYFKYLIIPSHLILDDNKSDATLNNLISKVATEIEKISSKLEDYKVTVTQRDGCIGTGGFQSGYISTKPFFTWKNEQNKNMISKLLSGDNIMIKADVRNSAPDKDAIKFNVIDFNFKSRNKTLQSQINDKLKGFQLTLTHCGNSYYRYKNKIYEMMSGNQDIWYYFEKKANGEPVHCSLSYKKIMYGNVTLSPYASWKIKLENVTDDITFKDLESYKNSVDLTLEGHGYFINKRIRNCVDLMVDQYYEAIDTYYYVYSKDEPNAVDNPYGL